MFLWEALSFSSLLSISAAVAGGPEFLLRHKCRCWWIT
jgi:hypothetical protein